MEKYQILLCALLFCLLSSFRPNSACKYAGSNIGFVKYQTQKAIEMTDINQTRYFAYKALNAVVKSKKQIADCGCEYAVLSMEEGLENLKKSTRTSTLGAAKILLKRALEDANDALEAILEYETQNSPYPADVLELNTKHVKKKRNVLKESDNRELMAKIDQSLIQFESSLDQVIHSVNCKEARAFAQKVHDQCAQQLLNSALSEGKKYYNLRTKEISAKALEQLGDCANKIINSK